MNAGGEGDDRGWDGWMASPTQWTWVWVNSGSWWWTGWPGVQRSMGSQRVRQDWATELNWIQLSSLVTVCILFGNHILSFFLFLIIFFLSIQWIHSYEGSFNNTQALSVTDLQFSSVTQWCPTLCNPMDCSKSGLPVHHQFPEFTQTHVHWVGNAIQPSHSLSSPSPPAFNLSQHQGLFQ